MTLVEIVVAMFMLAVILVAMIPLLITGIKVSVENTTRATANQLVNEAMETAARSGPTCSNVEALEGYRDVNDARGEIIRITTVVDACPAVGAANTVRVTATAARVGATTTLATAVTLVHVR